jgi:hypothetical protein
MLWRSTETFMLATVPRSGIAAAAFCMQLAPGGAVHAWSVLLNPLREHCVRGGRDQSGRLRLPSLKPA